MDYMKDQRETRIFPVGLLAENRPCIVIGGGRIATRKVKSLLEARARITVVSPELHPDLDELVTQGRITYQQRTFAPEDIQGAFLVFAATDDAAVNRAVIDLGKTLGVHVCSIDKSWTEGDFVTPASFRKGGLTVSVSTGGKSCRRSKLVKESLARHVEMVDTAGLIIIGTSHNFLPIEQREPYHLTERRLEEVAEMITQIWGVHEFALLNTCNRIELIAVVTRSPTVERVLRRILRFDQLPDSSTYLHRDEQAFSHMAVMTAGLLSQTPGENHIVAQVKNAVNTAVEKQWAAGMLQQWLGATLHISKHIRNDTAQLLHAQEIEDLCLHYLSTECPQWPAARVLVLGAGVVGQCIVELLTAQTRSITWCYHRNVPELPTKGKADVTLCGMNDLREQLARADVIICATASEGHVLHMGYAPFFNQEGTTVVVDLAMPRNVAPELNGIADSIRVVDLDDLKHWYRRKVADMGHIFEVSKDVVEQHKEMYDKLIQSFQGRNA